MKKAVFLDRDGVLNKLVRDAASGTNESPYKASEMELVDGAIGALKILREMGYLLIIISNQPAAAKGIVSLKSLREVERRFLNLLSNNGVIIDDCRYSYTHPEGVDAALKCESIDRKPAPGMVLKAALEFDIDLGKSWVVGDSDTDIELGERAGCRTILIENPLSAHRRNSAFKPEKCVSDVLAAAKYVAKIAK